MWIATEGNLNQVTLGEHTLSLELSGITLEQVQATPYLGLQLMTKIMPKCFLDLRTLQF